MQCAIWPTALAQSTDPEVKEVVTQLQDNINVKEVTVELLYWLDHDVHDTSELITLKDLRAIGPAWERSHGDACINYLVDHLWQI